MCDKCDVKNKCNCECHEDWYGYYIDINGYETDFCTKCNHDLKM